MVSAVRMVSLHNKNWMALHKFSKHLTLEQDTWAVVVVRKKPQHCINTSRLHSNIGMLRLLRILPRRMMLRWLVSTSQEAGLDTLLLTVRSTIASVQCGKAGQCSLMGQWTNPRC